MKGAFETEISKTPLPFYDEIMLFQKTFVNLFLLLKKFLNTIANHRINLRIFFVDILYCNLHLQNSLNFSLDNIIIK